LIPLTEIVGGAKTIGSRQFGRAAEFYTSIRAADECASTRKCPGMSPTASRLRWRARSITLSPKALWSAADVDNRLCWGPGLRWGVYGQHDAQTISAAVRAASSTSSSSSAAR